jgi:hypothetical protein
VTGASVIEGLTIGINPHSGATAVGQPVPDAELLTRTRGQSNTFGSGLGSCYPKMPHIVCSRKRAFWKQQTAGLVARFYRADPLKFFAE